MRRDHQRQAVSPSPLAFSWRAGHNVWTRIQGVPPAVISFGDRLAEAVRTKGTPTLVGLDPRWESLPAVLTPPGGHDSLSARAAAYEAFCRGVVNVVAPLVPAVKPQAAFFEELGPEGMAVLGRTIDYCHEKNLLVILDGKRNDIGSTAAAYARGILGPKPQSAWGADALTVSPYLGDDSLQPFVEVAVQRSAGLFVLVKTSNPGGGCSRTCSPRVAPFTGTLRPTSNGWPNRPEAIAATDRWERWSAPPIPGSLPSSARIFHTPGCSCPASAARAARPATWRRRSTGEGSGR